MTLFCCYKHRKVDLSFKKIEQLLKTLLIETSNNNSQQLFNPPQFRLGTFRQPQQVDIISSQKIAQVRKK